MKPINPPFTIIREQTIGPCHYTVYLFWGYSWTASRQGREDRPHGYAPTLEQAILDATQACRIMAGNTAP